MGGIVWKLLVIVISRPVSSVLRDLSEKAWASSRPGDPPRTASDPDAKWVDTVLWAVITGLSLTVGQLIATRGAGEIWRLFGGGETPQQRKLRQQSDKEAAKDAEKAAKTAKKEQKKAAKAVPA